MSSLLGIKIDGVAAGLWHTICISADGDVYAFGGNQFGQLGTGADQAEVLTRTIIFQLLNLTCGFEKSLLSYVYFCASFITCIDIIKLQLLLTYSFGKFQTDFASTPRSSEPGKCERKSSVLWGPPQCSCHRCVNLCNKQLGSFNSLQEYFIFFTLKAAIKYYVFPLKLRVLEHHSSGIRSRQEVVSSSTLDFC